MPDFPHPIDPQVVMPDALDLGAQHIVTLRPVRTPIRIALLSLAGVVAGWGNLQNPADRLDRCAPTPCALRWSSMKAII